MPRSIFKRSGGKTRRHRISGLSRCKDQIQTGSLFLQSSLEAAAQIALLTR